MPIPRRRISEIIAAHELERTLVDVYVEGRFDADLVTWYLLDAGHHHVQVYPIDAVHVATEDLGGLSSGQRQRVIALARALDASGLDMRISCICDRDFEDWLATESLPTNSLLLTDFVSMDAYLISTDALDKFLRLVVGYHSLDGTKLLSVLGPVLEDCFLIRLAHAKRQLSLSWFPPVRCCTLASSGEIHFDREGFLKRLLQKNTHWARKADLEAEMDDLRGRLRADLRTKAHGHDFSTLLAWYIERLNKAWSGDDERVFRALLGCVSRCQLAEFELFRSLETRCKRVLRHVGTTRIATAQPEIATDGAARRR